MSNYENPSNTCQTQTSEEPTCPIEKSIEQGCCPIESVTKMWQSAFFVAMKEAKVDILKEKIRKSWGPMLDKGADATVESMGIYWESILSQAKAKVSLQENIKEICQSAHK
jgi:hypothetical protein